ncbi:unnamed protein product [Rotaria sordida]|uniref:Uncharacterized protein n=1 Tax=Rotaria sordida TaxID=392033 RepID=A0A814CFV8_9BILA|nr:unnamed protein product [Rotaria sordida]
MTNTFLSTSKLPEIADIFASYNRTEQKLDREGKEGEVSIGCTFIIKNIDGHRRALDISGISEYPFLTVKIPGIVVKGQIIKINVEIINERFRESNIL